MPRHIVLTLLISLYQGSNKQELRRLHIDLKINFGITYDQYLTIKNIIM